MKITLTNNEINSIVRGYKDCFKDKNIILPAKVSFYIKKNITTLDKLNENIELVRMEIIQRYGTLDKENSRYNFTEDNMEKANNELLELFSIQQEVDVSMINLDWISDVNLTNGQMDAIMFMIEESA